MGSPQDVYFASVKPARRTMPSGYDKVVKQLQTDMPIAYLYFEPRIFGLNKSVQGFKPYPDGIVRLAGLTLAK
ncbi:hypothetical protein A3N35_12235 [Enterobacter hormaechei subsp. steigerwaltii]|nr:hypothetical protein A3N35_12235 [Enterobacter hormaechei subsp. steigerwaltii]KZQ05981.1 hypothetical protein A3N48_10790 [Enterobacter hormaechei subsp. steigerwaltii]